RRGGRRWRAPPALPVGAPLDPRQRARLRPQGHRRDAPGFHRYLARAGGRGLNTPPAGEEIRADLDTGDILRQSMAMAKPTINDVARLAGVSKKTVSRVINQSPLLNHATRAKVEAVIAEIGYAPDPQARA